MEQKYTYDKKLLSISQQIDRLISRGLIVDDKVVAEHYLGKFRRLEKLNTK